MPKKHRIEPQVELIPYYEYDPSIHNIEYRYLENAYEVPQPDSYAFDNSGVEYNADWQNAYRQPFPPYYGAPFGGYGRPRRRRRRRRPYYPGFGYGPGPGFVPLPLPLPVPLPYPPIYPPFGPFI